MTRLDIHYVTRPDKIMTNETSQTAETCEAIKISLRQTKDGLAITFAIHPDDIPRGVMLAPLGQRYALAMAQIDDDEQLKPKPKEFTPLSETPKGGATGSVQRAAILCSDVRFQKFLAETNSAWSIMNEGTPTERAAMLVRTHCGVKSRREIIPGSPAYEKWNKLDGQFQAWLRT